MRTRLRRRFAPFCAVLAISVSGCSTAGFPGEVSYDGQTLVKATDWSRGPISGGVFIPRGERMEEASIQLGIIVSRQHRAAEDLQRWILDQYHLAPIHNLYESVAADESCKAGQDPAGQGARLLPFLAMQICRSNVAAGISACVEADEVLDDERAGRCLSAGASCYQALCDARWTARRASLEPVLAAFLGK